MINITDIVLATGVGTINLGPMGSVNSPQELVRKALAIAWAVAGIVAAGMVGRAGFAMMTAQGNPEKYSKAQQSLIHAIVGITLIGLAIPLLNLVAKVVWGGGFMDLSVLGV
jgi:hypothetical protein